MSPPTFASQFIVRAAQHNKLGIARYLNHLYDSDMSVILPLKLKSSQALKTLCFKHAILAMGLI
jgi:hypothetical protein